MDVRWREVLVGDGGGREVKGESWVLESGSWGRGMEGEVEVKGGGAEGE
jgi:hypothetical protein